MNHQGDVLPAQSRSVDDQQTDKIRDNRECGQKCSPDWNFIWRICKD